MPKLTDANFRLERWYSTENRHEEHYFLADGLAAGYQESAYVFGYNPEIVSPQTVRAILDLIKREATCSSGSPSSSS